MNHDATLNKNKLIMPLYFILPIQTSFSSYKYCLRKYNKNCIGKQSGLIKCSRSLENVEDIKALYHFV